MPTQQQPQFTILKTSAAGAYLISDGQKTTWIKNNWLRADGTLTPAAIKALANGQPYLSPEQYAAKKEAAKWVTRPLSLFTLSASGKAYGTKVVIYHAVSEQSISRWLWLPASQCQVADDKLTAPAWLVEKKIQELKEEAATGSFTTNSMEVDF